MNEKNLKKQLEGAYQHWLEFLGKNEYLLGHCVVSLTENERLVFLTSNKPPQMNHF